MAPAPLVCTVDDDRAVSESLDGLLRSAGFAVRTFPSAEDFLGWLNGQRPDCVIVDFAMPRMNGLQLRRSLLERGFEIPFIFATAVHEEAVWSQLTSSGAFAVFAKPLDPDLLLDAVQRAVTTSKEI